MTEIIYHAASRVFNENASDGYRLHSDPLGELQHFRDSWLQQNGGGDVKGKGGERRRREREKG